MENIGRTGWYSIKLTTLVKNGHHALIAPPTTSLCIKCNVGGMFVECKSPKPKWANILDQQNRLINVKSTESTN